MFTNTEIGILVALIIAICEAVKRAGLKTRYVPLLAVVLGLVGSYAFSGDINWLSTASGVLVALSSQGLYDIGKRTVLNK